MKCMCGHNEYIYNENGEIIDENEKFIRSELKVTYETEGNYYKNLKSSDVYICPKCGTLKIERW